MKRRVFIKNSGKLALGSSLLMQACSDDDQPYSYGSSIQVDLNESPFDALLQEGNWVLHPSEKVILVNYEGTLHAFSSVCTHKKCSDAWVFGTTQATCTCHGSKFDYTGKLVQGPAKEDLKSFSISRMGNTLNLD